MSTMSQSSYDRQRRRWAQALVDKLAKHPGYVVCPQCNGVGSYPPMTRQCCSVCLCEGIVPESKAPR